MDADTTYRRFARYYDLYAGDFDADLEVYKSFCHANQKILEVGCGTGRVLQSLLQDGLVVTGVDISPEMLDLAREKLSAFYQQGSLRLYLHDFREQQFPEKYERALVTFYTFNYILDRPDTFLRHLLQSMTEDGLLIMDRFYPKTLAHPELDNVWVTHEIKRHGRNITLQDKRTLAGNIEERMQIYKEHNEATEIISVRRFYPPEEILRVLRTVGFKEIQLAQGYTLSAFQETIDPEQLRQNFFVKALKKA